MIRKTIRAKQEMIEVYKNDRRMHTKQVTTWWFLFIPVFISEKLLELGQ